MIFIFLVFSLFEYKERKKKKKNKRKSKIDLNEIVCIERYDDMPTLTSIKQGKCFSYFENPRKSHVQKNSIHEKRNEKQNKKIENEVER